MGKSKKSLKKINSSNVTDKYLLLGFLSIILLHILGGVWHSYYSWGFSYWYVVPKNVTILSGFISLACILIAYSLRYKVKL